MGRKPDPRGKDRPRSIVLSGDVAEIAQKLADEGRLSATISALLRAEYGMDSALEALEAELVRATDERKALQDEEDRLIAAINQHHEDVANRRATTLPKLKQQYDALKQTRARLVAKMSRAITRTEEAMIQRQLDVNAERLDAVADEMEGLQ